MHQVYILETEWPSGQVLNVEKTALVNDFAEAIRFVEKDLDATATADFKVKCMTDFINHRFVHLPNGRDDNAATGVMILFIPEIPL